MTITHVAPSLTDQALRDLFRPIEEDYRAAIVQSAALPNAERRGVVRGRWDAYVAALADALADAVEASVPLVRGMRAGGQR